MAKQNLSLFGHCHFRPYFDEFVWLNYIKSPKNVSLFG